MDEERLIFEKESMTTVDNAVFTKKLIDPQPNQRWILVTSAFHMSRSVGIFNKVGWRNIIPYPTDYMSEGEYAIGLSTFFDLGRSIRLTRIALKEMIALSYNWFTGKSSEFIPKQS